MNLENSATITITFFILHEDQWILDLGQQAVENILTNMQRQQTS